MSDWQKVRVQFTDADGNGVSAGMWSNSNYPTCAYLEANDSDVGIYMTWALNDNRIKVTPIRELPTGVGAVIRVSDYGDGLGPVVDNGDGYNIWVRNTQGLWTNAEADYVEVGPEWQYEILSEGIQL